MKKKMILLTVALMCVLMLSGCKCKHVWQDANCETPQVCSKCGETSGAALGHSWEAATCTAPETCATCGKIRGLALGHTWTEATCTQAETCSSCGMTKGEPLEHTWTDATCMQAETCSACGMTRGDPLEHVWVEANYQEPKICDVCETVEGEPETAAFVRNGIEAKSGEEGAEYAMTVADVPVTVRVTYCQEIEPENDYAALDGYVWLQTTVRLTAEAYLSALDTDMPIFSDFTDYYDIEGYNNSLGTYTDEKLEQEMTTFTVNYYGTDYTDCYLVMGEPEVVAPKDSEDGLGSVTYTNYFHIPQGYDGVVLIYGDNTRLETEYEGDYMKLLQDENTLFLRLG